MAQGRGDRCLLVELAPALASVSAARGARRRRAVAPPADVGANAALIVSELATNAVLHARTTFIVVARRKGPNGIRLEVTDASRDPVEMPLPPPPLASGVLEDPEELEAIREALVDAGTTGRGLSLVAELSDGWGVTPARSGKTVWAELAAAGPSGHDVVDGSNSEADEADAFADVADPPAGAGTRAVRLIAVPVRLIVESDRHYDDLVRELQVMALDHGGDNPLPAREIGALVEEAEHHLGRLRHAGRLASPGGTGCSTSTSPARRRPSWDFSDWTRCCRGSGSPAVPDGC